MKLLIREATVIDPRSPFHNQTCDLVIEDGLIQSIQPSSSSTSETSDQTYDAKGQYLSPGWFDMRVNFRDPGFEHKEDLDSGIRVAASGGYTGVACLPDTAPITQTKAGVEYIINKTHTHIVDVHPMGALTQDFCGANLSELYDMHQAGAVGFTDANNPIRNSKVLTKGLLYTQTFDGVIFSHPDEGALSQNGQMNEGSTSTSMGIKGMPAIAETMAIQRDLSVLEYTGGRLHFSHISTAKSVALVRQAKQGGLAVTADVSIWNILYTDEVLTSFDSNYKLLPPLRTQEDVNALIEGLKDGTIDAIVSDHLPEDVESKKVEFDYAAFGAIGLQSLFAAYNTFLSKQLPLELLIEKIAISPRQILKVDVPTIAENTLANFTIFDTETQWTYTKEINNSKSENSPLLGQKLTGKALAIYNKHKLLEL